MYIAMTNLSLMTLLVSQRVCAARALMRGGGEDQQIIRNLVQNHHLIERTHTNRDDGIDSHTWSENPQVSDWIKTHVAQMTARLEQGRGIRLWDPVFQAVFDNFEHLTMKVTNTTNGVDVTELGDNDCSIGLAQAHANIIALFVQDGSIETQKKHYNIPESCAPLSATSTGGCGSGGICNGGGGGSGSGGGGGGRGGRGGGGGRRGGGRGGGGRGGGRGGGGGGGGSGRGGGNGGRGGEGGGNGGGGRRN